MPCTECEYKSATNRDLRRHIEAKHKGVRYKCDLCDFTASVEAYIKIHKQAKHEENTYPCDLDILGYACEYTGSTENNLTVHKRKVHSQNVFPCDICEFVANTAQILKDHEKSEHPVESVLKKMKLELSCEQGYICLIKNRIINKSL